MKARIAGTGMCVPDRVVTNDELAGLMDTSDEWIRQRTGIQERRWISDGETPAALAQQATQNALEAAGIDVDEVDCILLATLSGQHDFPGTSFFLHELLDAGETPCIDLRAQCSGFLYGLTFAESLIVSGRFRRVLLLGCEVHSTGVEVATRGRDVAVLFGDGAGAVLLEANDDESNPSALLDVKLHAQGKHARKLWIEGPSSANRPVRITHEMIEDGRAFPQMQGKFVFKHAVTRMPEVLRECLDSASVKIEDVDLFLFHQANLRINEYVAGQLEIPPEKLTNNIQRYGNCSAASIPMLLDEAVREGRLQRGQLVSMTAFGSGFTWGSALVRY
jgi:3-oxoacyl-[acyl-carrier-protein] synthase-3